MELTVSYKSVRKWVFRKTCPVLDFSVFIMVAFPFCDRLALAELHFGKLAGINDLLLPSYQYLSPVYGFSLLRKGTLENIYRYGDPLSNGAKDPTIQLIREMFTVPPNDQANFLPTKLPSKASFYFKSSTIGKIINRLGVQFTPEELAQALQNPSKKQALQEELEAMIQQDTGLLYHDKNTSNIDKLETEKKLLFRKKNQKSAELVAIQKQCQDNPEHASPELQSSLKNLQEDLSALSEQMRLKEEAIEREKQQGLNFDRKEARRNIRPFVEFLLQSLTQTEKPDSIYPRQFALQVLLSLFWTKAPNDKHEILTFLTQMPLALKDPKLESNPGSIQHFLEADYSKSQLEHVWEKRLNEASTENTLNLNEGPENTKARTALAADLMAHPDQALYLARWHEIQSREMPPLIKQGNADFEGRTFADCFESTIQNLANMMLRQDSGIKMNIDRLIDKAKKKGFELNTEFVQFYRDFPTIENPFDQKRRNAWARLTSRIPGIQYLEPPVNIPASVDHLLKVYEHFLFSKDPHYLALKSEPDFRKKQLDYLCDFLSDREHELQWKPRGHTNPEVIQSLNTNVELEFAINEKPMLLFNIGSEHAEPFDLSNNKPDWRAFTSPYLSLASSNSKRLSASTRELIAWMTPESMVQDGIQKLVHQGNTGTAGLPQSTLDATHLLLSQPLISIDSRLSFIEAVVENKMHSLYAVALKLLHELPANDFHIQCGIVNALMHLESPPPNSGQPESSKYQPASYGSTLNEMHKFYSDSLIAIMNTDPKSKVMFEAAAFGWLNLLNHFHSKLQIPLGIFNSQAYTLPEIAAQNGQIHILKYLTSKHQSITATNEYTENSPLMWAIRRKQLETVKYYFSNFRDSFTGSPLEWQPLHEAAKSGRLEIFQFINYHFPTQIDQLSNHESPLHLAVRSGNMDLIKEIATKYKNLLKIRNLMGDTPSQVAIKRHKLNTVRFLGDIDPTSLETESNRKSTLSALCHDLEVDETLVNMIKYILEKAPKESLHECNGISPIRLAIYLQQFHCLELYLKFTPQLAPWKNPRGSTPIQWAAHQGHWESVKFLAEKYPNMITERDSKGQSIIDLAKEANQMDLVKHLATLTQPE